MAGGKTSSGAKKATVEKAPRNNTTLILGVVGGIAVLILIAVFILNPSGGSQPIEDETAQVTIDGVSLPLMPPSAPQDSTANGLVPPDVSGSNFGGEPVSITNDGRAKGIVFVAHWCPHCQEEVPRVQQWIDGGGSVDGVDLYSVSTSVGSTRANYPPSDWLEAEGWTIPVLRDDADGSTHVAYGGGGFPYWVFVNSDGTVALRTSGQLQTDQLVQILESLN
jgi:thiol-disulfide isomerase/thioredoxin